MALGFSAALLACSSEHADHSMDDRGVADAGDAALPPEEALSTLTLWPAWEWPISEAEVGAPVPLGGVEVCVARKRPWNGAWDDFDDVDGPCETSVTGEKVVLRGVPGPAELILTASKAGYLPRAIAVTMWAQDLDVTDWFGAQDSHVLALRRSGAALPGGAEAVGAATGELTVGVVVTTRQGVAMLGGAVVSLEPEGAVGPKYVRDGRVDPQATETAPASSLGHYSAVFENVSEGEYLVPVAHPRAFCAVAGGHGEPILGFARTDGLISAPILPGYTLHVAAMCLCRSSEDLESCAPEGDAGSDAAAP